ncbi:hypoxanthine phosphoribosyltransferase [Arthrobacter bambusae]|uniref:Hypoxanthine phosphoribosyltransferase n=1 Tax=Arthrobacter bambusae TaxID=1338426 RepID=A0AAW8DCM1_9MICC|nr:hypoxanthine phosphoribosyltransferase [Arthrobacter bambusae]MDQ0127468.1 hypoxanthine phosphoribosyltransferase [Arthrobacter bambusae]MDQ0178810.1 hypoxanthine phosphoribosyltransferase [Arthrobacter bambusae]
MQKGGIVVANLLEEFLDKRPVDREMVEAHKKQLLDQVRAYPLQRLPEASDLT